MVGINHYNVIIAGLNSSHQPVKVDARIHENIKNAKGQEYVYQIIHFSKNSIS